MSGTITRVEIEHSTLGVRIVRSLTSADIYVTPSITGSVDGLCGNETSARLTVAGTDMVVDDLMDQAQLDRFANSWQREPSDQILREDRRECGKLDLLNLIY